MQQISKYLSITIGWTFLLVSLSGLLFYCFCLPAQLFERPSSTVLLDRESNLMHARIAEDGQWRFPLTDSVPSKFQAALLTFEDEYFFLHNGVHGPSMCRALYLNLSHGRVVSGGSTISMQVVRLSRKNPSRTIWEKALEMIRARKLEAEYSKEEILRFYASHAPMGGNVVGLDAAAWRYFGRSPFDLSWSEAATLAVLPNAPSLIFPGKNQELLLTKRNKLLKELAKNGLLGETDLKLALTEPLPGKPKPLPQRCAHLADRLMTEGQSGERVETTIDPMLQRQCERILELHHKRLSEAEIHNGAILVIDARKGEVLAYVGNTEDAEAAHGNAVDIIRAPRSTGSILKPFLYAAMLNEGSLMPDELVADVPMSLSGYSPKNYTRQYDGAVPASRALSRSLNVPSVLMLRRHGVAPLLALLRDMGFQHLNRSADHYGLSLILGGGEASLFEICSAYAGMSRSLTHYQRHGVYPESAYGRIRTTQKKAEEIGGHGAALLDAGSIYHTFNALQRVNRPENEAGWQYYSSSSPVAWKTGTSFGSRDAWAVGTSPDVVVGVWIGNADGEGRPGVTGIQAAAPVLFEVLDLFGMQPNFTPPLQAMVTANICPESGHRAGRYCPETSLIHIPPKGKQSQPCRLHRQLFLHRASGLQADSRCFSIDELEVKSWFVLPPAQEWFYQRNHPEYKSMPVKHPACADNDDDQPIELLYPHSKASVSIPTGLDGSREKVILKAAHREPGRLLHWHLDQTYLGSTREVHMMEIDPPAGEHLLTLVDESGHMLARTLKFITAD